MAENSYTVCVLNQSNYTCSYFLFALPAAVKPALNATEYRTSVFTSLRSVPGSNAIACVSLPKQLAAICGTICNSETGHCYREVLDRRQIELAQRQEDGTVSAGTTLAVGAQGSQPFFQDDLNIKPTLAAGTFTLMTRPDFTFDEAKSEEMVAGYAGPWQGVRHSRAFGHHFAFTPRPYVRYEIEPRPIFGIAIGDLGPRDCFDPQNYHVCVIDFEALTRDEVEIVHDDRNRLRLQLE